MAVTRWHLAYLLTFYGCLSVEQNVITCLLDVQVDVVGVRQDNWTDLGKCKWGTVPALSALAKELDEKVRRYSNSSAIILSTMNSSHGVTEVDILNDLVAPEKPDLSPESARAVLELRFRQRAIDRMNELAEKNRHGTLAEAERNELERYLRVGNFLNLIQGKARNSLAKVS